MYCTQPTKTVQTSLGLGEALKRQLLRMETENGIVTKQKNDDETRLDEHFFRLDL